MDTSIYADQEPQLFTDRQLKRSTSESLGAPVKKAKPSKASRQRLRCVKGPNQSLPFSQEVEEHEEIILSKEISARMTSFEASDSGAAAVGEPVAVDHSHRAAHHTMRMEAPEDSAKENIPQVLFHSCTKNPFYRIVEGGNFFVPTPRFNHA